jgi:anti-sigma-K factor RskA
VTNHDPFRELIEAYALGALDPADRAALEAHLRSGCPACAAALEEARSLVSRLAYLAPDVAPSEILKGRLMQTVRAETRKQRSSLWIPSWMWAAAAAMLLFALYNAWDARQLRKHFQEMQKSTVASSQDQEELHRQLEATKREAMILTDPKSETFVLPASDKQMPQMKAMWHERLGLCILGQKIPMPKGNRTLQLWLIPKAPGSKPMPSMTLRPDADGSFCLVVANPPEDMHDTKALAITEEPAGGSPQPTGAPMWVASIS